MVSLSLAFSFWVAPFILLFATSPSNVSISIELSRFTAAVNLLDAIDLLMPPPSSPLIPRCSNFDRWPVSQLAGQLRCSSLDMTLITFTARGSCHRLHLVLSNLDRPFFKGSWQSILIWTPLICRKYDAWDARHKLGSPIIEWPVNYLTPLCVAFPPLLCIVHDL